MPPDPQPPSQQPSASLLPTACAILAGSVLGVFAGLVLTYLCILASDRERFFEILLFGLECIIPLCGCVGVWLAWVITRPPRKLHP
jgi:hypothetical protein